MLTGKLESLPSSAKRLFSLSSEYLRDGMCLEFNHLNKTQVNFPSHGDDISGLIVFVKWFDTLYVTNLEIDNEWKGVTTDWLMEN